MDMIYKMFRAEVLGVNADEGTVDMFIPVSTDSVDRDGEIVEPLAFKKTLPKFMKRPILVASHDYRDLTNLIGEWSKLKITEGGLEGKPKYYTGQGNAQADWGFKLAEKGMAAFSIGFIPKEWVDGDGVKEPRRTYKEVELLEISQVIVPSNREAIQSIRSKSVDPIINEICDAVEEDISDSNLELDNNTNLITKPEETEEFIHIPAKGQEGKHEGHRIRVIPIDKDKGIQAKYCGDCKVITSYMFEKANGWDMAKARAWVKEHEGKSLEVEHEISQAEIIDEIDYLKSLIDKEGLSDKAKEALKELIKRCPADDIAVEIIDFLHLKPVVEVVKKTETLTNLDILESIKRIGGL